MVTIPNSPRSKSPPSSNPYDLRRIRQMARDASAGKNIRADDFYAPGEFSHEYPEIDMAEARKQNDLAEKHNPKFKAFMDGLRRAAKAVTQGVNTEPERILSARFEAALVYAAQKHASQLRKGTDIPYIAHLLGVASIVLEHGGNEVEAIASLLHDTIEDQGGEPTQEDSGRISSSTAKTPKRRFCRVQVPVPLGRVGLRSRQRGQVLQPRLLSRADVRSWLNS